MVEFKSCVEKCVVLHDLEEFVVLFCLCPQCVEYVIMPLTKICGSVVSILHDL